MLTTIGFILFGYFTGSLLFARYFSNLFCGKDVTVDTPDSNPGTYNAYTYGGFWCGALTLVCDLLKGIPAGVSVHQGKRRNSAWTGACDVCSGARAYLPHLA